MSDSSQITTFYVLVDFMTFFDEIFSKRHETALTVRYSFPDFFTNFEYVSVIRTKTKHIYFLAYR